MNVSWQGDVEEIKNGRKSVDLAYELRHLLVPGGGLRRLSIQEGEYQRDADQVFVYIHLVPFSFGGGVPQDISNRSVQAIAYVRLNNSLPMVPVHDDQRIRREHSQELR
jgi:hypothetical protein